jgi:hypothetical protein
MGKAGERGRRGTGRRAGRGGSGVKSVAGCGAASRPAADSSGILSVTGGGRRDSRAEPAKPITILPHTRKNKILSNNKKKHSYYKQLLVSNTCFAGCGIVLKI